MRLLPGIRLPRSGAFDAKRLLPLVLLAGAVAAAAFNNVLLVQSERAVTAPASPLWVAITEEASSALLILLLAPAVQALVRRWPVWPRPRAGTLLLHVAGSVVFSALHVGGMVALRHVVFALNGARYRFGDFPQALAYEYAKDAVAYALIVLLLTFVERIWRDSPNAATGNGSTNPAALIRVKTARGTVAVAAAQISRIEATGNYVTLHTEQGALLHRATMQEMLDALPPGDFVRTHRSHIVSRSRVAAITGGDGARMVRLHDGSTVPLSRRHARDGDSLQVS